jgi:ATPase subunit of ABC transporter with duplicated ATPase domains
MQHQGGTLAANDISVQRGADAILKRVSLAVMPGSRIGVVGPNGRGKTTLLRALAGLEELDGGSVRRNPPSLRVGFLPQERDLVARETLIDYLARRAGEESTAEFESRAGSTLRRVGLDVDLERGLSALSGGEKSRAALASILLARFDVYLLDEPTNDLDFQGLELLERFLLRMDAGYVVV